MCAASELQVDDLPPQLSRSGYVAIPGATMKEIESEAVRATFEATGGSTERTAEVLGLSLRTIQYRLNELGLARGRGRPRKSEQTG